MKKVFVLALTFINFACPGFARNKLGLAETFAVLGGSTVTNTGVTEVRGNLGVYPGTTITGFPPGVILNTHTGLGKIHLGDAYAQQAQADLSIAYDAIAALPCDFDMTGQDLGGRTLTPGVYCFNTSAQLTGTLVLDFQGSSEGGFVFQIGSTLTTASGSTVESINCSRTLPCRDPAVPHAGCSVTWRVGSSATFGTSTVFRGNVLALTSISLNTNVLLYGRALARNGAVTLDSDKVYFQGTLTPLPMCITGNGQIPVPQPDSSDTGATGSGQASFAFIGGGAGNLFDYLNHVTGLRIYGPITDVRVVTVNKDGTPKTVRFSGTCHRSLPRCSFSGLTGTGDFSDGTQFGVSIRGDRSEDRASRSINGGHVEIH